MPSYDGYGRYRFPGHNSETKLAKDTTVKVVATYGSYYVIETAIKGFNCAVVEAKKTVDGWLTMYAFPTVSGKGRDVEI